jgi:hypothetical protein
VTVDLAPSRILPHDGALRLGAVHTRKLIKIHLNLLAVRRDRDPTPNRRMRKPSPPHSTASAACGHHMSGSYAARICCAR